MKVALYARVSTEDQELQQQVTSCRLFCEYKGYEVARVFSEKVSGAKAKRPQYLELVKELRQMQYGGVVVFRLDRLGRNSRELALLIDELENKGIKVLSVNESFDTSTAMGRAMRELIYVFAQLEREQISEATTQRLAAVKLAGKRLGQNPLSEFQVNKIKGLVTLGLNCRKIASQMHLSKSTAYNVVRQKRFYQLSDETAEN